MVNDFDGDAAGFGLVEGAGGIAIEAFPGGFVNLGFQSRFKGFVGIVGSEEVGMADEEAFFVVVGVDEPAGDAFGSTGFDFARLGAEDIDSVDFDLDLLIARFCDFDVGFTKDDKEVARSGVFEVVGHVQVGVHAGFEDGDAAELGEVGGVGIVAEGTGNQNIEPGIAGFTGGGD